MRELVSKLIWLGVIRREGWGVYRLGCILNIINLKMFFCGSENANLHVRKYNGGGGLVIGGYCCGIGDKCWSLTLDIFL